MANLSETDEELMTFVCDSMCHYSYTCNEQELEEKCKECKISKHLSEVKEKTDNAVKKLEEKIKTAERQIINPPHDVLDKAANDVANDFIAAYKEAIGIVKGGDIE